jgi:hypothetical protein
VPNINDIHSSAYRSSASNREDVQSNVGYHDLAVSSDGKQESYSQTRRQQEEAESSRTIVQPKVYYVPAPVASTSSQRASEATNQQRISMAVRPGTTTVLRVPINVVHTPGIPSQQFNSRTSTGSAYQASGTETRPTYTVYYAPATYDRYASSGNQYDTSRTSTVQQPEKYRTPDLANYNSYNSQSRSQNEDESESYQTRVSPSTITDGGSSRYAMSGSSLNSRDQSRVVPSSYSSYNSQSRAENEDVQESETYQTRVNPTVVDDRSRYSSNSASNVQRDQSRVVKPFPVQSIESASLTSQRTAEEQQQRRYTPARPNYVQRGYTNEDSRSESSRSENSRTENTNIYAPVVPITSSQSRLSQSQQQQQSQFASRAGNTYSPYSPSFGTSSRLGSGITYSNSDNLNDYMSESERLARLQQQQVANSRQSSSSASHSSVAEANRRTLEMAQRLDSAAANFVGSTNLSNRNAEVDAENIGGVDAGGFQRVKSWQKQSKWESGKFLKYSLKFKCFKINLNIKLPLKKSSSSSELINP